MKTVQSRAQHICSVCRAALVCIVKDCDGDDNDRYVWVHILHAVKWPRHFFNLSKVTIQQIKILPGDFADLTVRKNPPGFVSDCMIRWLDPSGLSFPLQREHCAGCIADD